MMSARISSLPTVAIAAAFLMSCLTASCRHADAEARGEALPPTPDYADGTQWYSTDRGASADIFYVISTETGDYVRPGGSVCHYADTYADSLRLPMLGEMQGVDELLSGDLNFFSPFYRQCSLQSFTSQSLMEERLATPRADILRAFEFYLKNINGGRPFVLMGFSQGAMLMLDLMKEMDDETFGRLIAAYAIGIGIDSEALASNPRIVPAEGEDDTGVTICYNSVRDTACSLWRECALGINPVNWRRDTTAATLLTEPSPLLPLDAQKPDTLTVRLDTRTNLLLVGGYTATDYILPLIGREGNYHSREVWLYRSSLRANIRRRAEEWVGRRGE